MARKNFDPAFGLHFQKLCLDRDKKPFDFYGPNVSSMKRISQTTYYAVARDGARPQDPDVIKRFCDILGCSRAEFLSDEAGASATQSNSDKSEVLMEAWKELHGGDAPKDKNPISWPQLKDLLVALQKAQTATGMVSPQKRVARKRIPRPHPDFELHKMGNMTLPLQTLEWFDEPYFLGESKGDRSPLGLKIEFNSNQLDAHFVREDFPAALTTVLPALQQEVELSWDGKTPLKNNWLLRLDDYSVQAEGGLDELGELTLYFGLTRFLVAEALHRNLDAHCLPFENECKTIRETFSAFPYNVRDSVLGNVLGTHTVLVSDHPSNKPRRRVLIQQRIPERVTSYKGWWQTSSAGFTSPAHTDTRGAPNPFVTAYEETVQEVGSALKNRMCPGDFRLLGLTVGWQNLSINAHFYAETNVPVKQIIHSRARKEGRRKSIPFSVEAVMKHLTEEKWDPYSTFGMWAALVEKFGEDEVNHIAETFPEKPFEAFYESR